MSTITVSQNQGESNEVLDDLPIENEIIEDDSEQEEDSENGEVEETHEGRFPHISLDALSDDIANASQNFEQVSLDDNNVGHTSGQNLAFESKYKSPTFGVFRNAKSLFSSSSSSGNSSSPVTSPNNKMNSPPGSGNQLSTNNNGLNSAAETPSNVFWNIPLTTSTPDIKDSSKEEDINNNKASGTFSTHEESIYSPDSITSNGTPSRSSREAGQKAEFTRTSQEDSTKAKLFSWSNGVPHKPSTLESVLSQTRPSYLPPKPKTEDKKHIQEYQKMLKAAKQAELKREQRDQKLKQERDKVYENITHIWENDILPNWKTTMKEQRTRDIIWTKGVPPRDRGRVWALSIGNAQACGKETYTIALERARKAFLGTDGKAANVAEIIEADIKGTLTSLSIFQKGGPYHGDLRNLLYAITLYRTDLGYVRGVNCIASMLLVNMSAPDAFICLVNLLNRRCLQAFYNDDKEVVDGYFRIFTYMFAEQMPKLHKHFADLRLDVAHFLPTWFITLFVHHLPLDVSARMLDIYFLEDDSVLFLAAMACLRVLEARLYGDADEVTNILENEDELKWVNFGVNESNFLEAMRKSGETFRPGSWERMCERELPGS